MKNYVLGLSVLVVGAAFVSCSKNDVSEENRSSFIDSQKSEYRTNFEAKYGKVAPNQSWDFTDLSSSASARTRAIEEVSVEETKDIWADRSFLNNDKAALKANIPTASVKDWNANVAVAMFPVFCHDEAIKGDYFRLAANNTPVSGSIKIKNDAWWSSNGKAPANKGRNVRTANLGADSWKIQYLNNKKEVVEAVTISSYKEVTVNGRTYWCFDVNGNGDYIDLIFLVAQLPVPTSKRYLVEDLGSKDDFDFNDIVFDVIQDENGNQKAIVRAMGGTLDFTLKIGNTTWTKSAAFDAATMYNTQATPDWTKVLAEFPVTGWVPGSNNVSVSVQSQASKDVIIELPFPKVGEVPMIIALKVFDDWMLERVSLPEDWYYLIEEED